MQIRDVEDLDAGHLRNLLWRRINESIGNEILLRYAALLSRDEVVPIRRGVKQSIVYSRRQYITNT